MQEQHIVWAQQASPGIDPSQGPLESLWFTLCVYNLGVWGIQGERATKHSPAFQNSSAVPFPGSSDLIKKKPINLLFLERLKGGAGFWEQSRLARPATPPSPGSAARLGQHGKGRRPL